jgi:demethylmenaquinone methyltransferase / 2-methoxy-6-polyprenyl-1,4-benzoquinol methylase
MNDVMSFGMHRLWKKIFVDHIEINENAQILDMASGTGDIAFKIYEKFQKNGDNVAITLADINPDMLEVAKDRIIDKNLNKEQFNFHLVNGENTKLEDNSFDYYTIAYGIRNFTDLSQGLKEAYRVLKPGGKFLCLEFSDIPDGLFKQLYDFYSFNVIPKFGKMITGNEESYQYFIESIRMFPKPKEFTQMISDNKFKNAKFKNLFSGITTIYSAEK